MSAAPTAHATADGAPMPSPRSLPRVIAPVRAAAAVLAVGAAAIGGYFTLAPTAQAVAYVAIGGAAVIAIFAGALVRPRRARLPWYLFAAGFACEIAGDAAFSFYELVLGREPPVPSLADALYLSGYPLIAVGIVLLVRQLGGQTSRVAQLDMAIVTVAVATVQWVFFVGGYPEESLPVGERLVAMAYPSMGVLLFVGFAQLIVSGARRSPTYWLLGASVALWIVADQIYGLTIDTYVSGHWIDGLWLGSYVVWAAAALTVSRTEFARRDDRVVPRLTALRAALLASALLAAPATAVVERLLDRRIHVFEEAIGASVIAVLVLVRLTGLLNAVERARADERAAREVAEEMQRRLAEQNERLLELDRLKDDFVSNVSHELRSPLTSISGYTEVLLDNARDDQTRGFLNVVDRNATRLLELVDDLLLTAQLQAGGLELHRHAFDLRAVVDETLESAARHADAAGVDLSLRVAGDLPRVDGDRGRVSQVVTNLVANAIKFTPPGGRVDVALFAREGTVVLEVADTGFGVSEAEAGHLFDRFFRSRAALDRQIPGTGLGLYISKLIVDAHNGRIDVRSVDGGGTTFTVDLPAAA